MSVKFHLKILYSVYKNKNEPTYMLKSILVNFDKKLKLDSSAYKKHAFDVIKIVKPSSY